MVLHGVLALDKPQGATSTSAVEEVKSALRSPRAGHAGTLDPMATGLLLVCFGEACKAVPFLHEGEKAYLATLRLGIETDTLDAAGDVVSEAPVDGVTAGAVEASLCRFSGEFDQEAPAFSAIKVRGRRLHELARAGKGVCAPVRRVRVSAIRLVAFERPYATLEVTCGKGFYVRSLARDVGRALQCGAHLTALRRTRIGDIRVEDAIRLDALARHPETASILSVERALSFLPRVCLDARGEAAIRAGRLVACDAVAVDGALLALLNARGRLVAVARAVNGMARPERVFFPTGME
jgi:tRNA pseudouridine55 synthase